MSGFERGHSEWRFAASPGVRRWNHRLVLSIGSPKRAVNLKDVSWIDSEGEKLLRQILTEAEIWSQ
jgi:hypothetical protein